MNTIKTSWFYWWAWSSEKMELWLEKLELEGWNLYQVDFAGIRFKFKRGVKQSIRYCVDFQPLINDDYITLFQEDGWELLWSGAGGWYLWKKSYQDERPEIFTDTNSLIDRNNRLTRILVPLFAMLIVIFIVLLLMNRPEYKYLIWFYVLIIGLYSYILYQFAKYNKKLKDNLRE